MMRKHRPSLAYKRQMQPNRTYGDLRQKHKAKIADWMFKSVCEYYREHGEMPKGAAVSAITDKVYGSPMTRFTRSFSPSCPNTKFAFKRTGFQISRNRPQILRPHPKRKGAAVKSAQCAAEK